MRFIMTAMAPLVIAMKYLGGVVIDLMRAVVIGITGLSIAFIIAIALHALAAEKPVSYDITHPDILEMMTIAGELDGATVASVTSQVAKINQDKLVKAVFLTVDSPGGGAVASSQIYEELSKLKVPVVAWCDSECASGAMYILMAPSIKFIALRSETITGSIGVIAQIKRYNRLLDWARIDSETLKSGALKDAGNPERQWTDQDRKYLQSIIDELAARFYAVIARTRKIKDWDAVKSARIFIGKDAVDVGLVDAVMSREQAVAKAKAVSGSSAIFTRDEISKVSGSSGYGNRESLPRVRSDDRLPSDDFAWLVKQFKAMLAGDEVRFEYRIPYQF